MSGEDFPPLPQEPEPDTAPPAMPPLEPERFAWDKPAPAPMTAEEKLTKMIRRALGGGDGGIMTRPNNVERASYRRTHRYRH
jgi:hypothetical protein